MNRKILTAAVAALAFSPTAAWATVDENQDGDTVLSVLEDGFKIEVRDLTEPGASVRVYTRPRNGNCVTANVNKVTRETAIETSDANYEPAQSPSAPYLHDNPMCNDSKWGYFSADLTGTSWQGYADGVITHIIHGTLKSYKIEVTYGYKKTRYGTYTKYIKKLRSH